MKKISFSQLESARNSPAAFAKSLKDENTSVPRFSKFMAWQLAVYHYHKERGNLSKAINYFESLFMRNFVDNAKNIADRENLLLELQAYSTDNEKRKLTYIEHKKRINIPLTSKLRLAGELPLIKMNNRGGYSVYFFNRQSAHWEEELRFPIIQHFVATTLYNVDLNEVEVGVYSLDFQKHLQRCYSNYEVDEAVQELQSLGQTISSIL